MTHLDDPTDLDAPHTPTGAAPSNGQRPEPPKPTFEEVAQRYATITGGIVEQIRQRIVGQDDVIRDVIASLVCGGHVLLEGVPGLGKTELFKTLAESVSASFSRIQFTPDLMPADVVGTEMIARSDDGDTGFRYRAGPVFANLLLADEINRATPKTQSALLEAMQERQVTVGGETRLLPDPFMVLATQNPIELEGTYPLPEAQLDRFFVKVLVKSPSAELLTRILTRTTGQAQGTVTAVCGPDELQWLVRVTRKVPIAQPLVEYAAALVTATHPASEHAPDLVRRYVRTGASPRGGQAMILAAKARAMFAGRPYVAGADLADAARSTLRHRVLLGYEAIADSVDADQLIDEVVAATVDPSLNRRGLA